MAYYREKLCRRQKACLVLSIFILLLGLLQFCLETLFWLWWFYSPCHKVKHVVVGIYLIVAGISGCAGYSVPRRPRSPLKTSQSSRSRGYIALFVLFCVLVTAVVIMDNTQFNCYSSFDVHEVADNRLHDRLAIVEISGLYLAHLLCALCIGLSFPDLWSSKSKWLKSEKLLNSHTKQKSSKQALHLPEAHTHVQEAAGTGDKVTVVSLPETDGIVYAVPEEQYVIRRGDATYMAPVGNTHLTAFFPTYRSQSD